MNVGAAPPGWYPDPNGGGQRYFDGTAWTGYTAPWAPQAQPWKGATYGRPAYGPGSLTDPGRRLGARVLDGLVFLPVTIAVRRDRSRVGCAPRRSDVPEIESRSECRCPDAGIHLAVPRLFRGGGRAERTLRSLRNRRDRAYGRTLGKRWLKIRPVMLDGQALGWGRSFGRAAAEWFASALGWIGLVNYLWCLWDANTQCVHDKVAGTLVINDM